MEITPEFTRYIEEGIPFSFSKYGDGEYMCVAGFPGANCDGDTYTNELREDLAKSFVKIVEQGGFVGRWWHDNVVQYWENTVKDPSKVRWVNYHSAILDSDVDSKIEFYKSIKKSKFNKIYIHNYLLKKVKYILDIDNEVIIDIRNWYKYKEEIITEIQSKIKEGETNIILTSMGMGAKVIISHLKELYPHNIYIDIGSALDLICTKRDSRGYSHYNTHKQSFLPLLPDDWEHDKYNYIYEEAKIKLGIHL